MKIIHQQQPTADSCASACIAMLLDAPVEKVIEKFHDKYINHEMNVHHYLLNHGLAVECLTCEHWQAQWGNLYLLTVASLHKKGVLHYIILDVRLEGVVDIYDPNMGKEGKKYYVDDNKENKTEFEVGLTSYVAELIIKN